MLFGFEGYCLPNQVERRKLGGFPWDRGRPARTERSEQPVRYHSAQLALTPVVVFPGLGGLNYEDSSRVHVATVGRPGFSNR